MNRLGAIVLRRSSENEVTQSDGMFVMELHSVTDEGNPPSYPKHRSHQRILPLINNRRECMIRGFGPPFAREAAASLVGSNEDGSTASGYLMTRLRGAEFDAQREAFVYWNI